MKAAEPEENLDASNYPQDEEGNVHGFFSRTCEFCMETILPFPTTEQQQRQSPEELFCCEEYRQFIEVVLAEETQGPSATLIDIKPHAHYGNKKDRKMAQQKAQLRMRERELLRQRRQSMQSNSQQSSYQTSSRQSRNTNPGLERERSAKVSKDNKEAKETKEQKETKDPKEGLAANFALFPASQPRRATRHSSALEHFGDRPPAAAYNAFAPEQTLDVPDKGAGPPSTSIRDRTDLDSVVTKREKKLTAEGFFRAVKKRTTDSSLTSSSEVARQMKTINYQLSSQRCLEEGWTVRPPSPMMLDETEDIFIPEPLDPAFAALGKTRKHELIQKYYGDGSPFITIFPDGSGNVFYSSGQVAVVISSQGPGQFTYLVMDDSSEPQVMGVFGSNGHASCCYANRKLRLFLDEYGGIELDRVGAKKRKWFWNDTETHVHAPPFQPVCFALTPHIAVRLMTQENMSLTFRCKARSCKLPVGAKLKLVNPENYPAKEIDADALFIHEVRAKTQTILNRISNLLHFPNSPKVEKILPPLHITTRVHKNERMQQQREAAMAAAKAKQEKRRHIRPLVVS